MARGLWLPMSVYQERIVARRKKEIEEMARHDPIEEERSKRDTKPLMYMDTSDPSRPVMVVGGGGMWYEDMKEKAKRLKEKSNPLTDPERPKSDPNEDLKLAVEKELRKRKRGE